MKFLVDECCHRRLAPMLRDLGHDVVCVALSYASSSDDVVTAIAHEQDRIIVTYDYDFGEIVVRFGTTASGVVLMGCPTLLPPERLERVFTSIRDMGEGLLGNLTNIDLEKVRQRPLP